MTSKQDRVVAYFYDDEIGNYCYGGGNPMRPHRARMVYSLVSSYDLQKQMIVHRPEPRSFEQLTEFHADEYIDFLRTITPNNAQEYDAQLKRFNMGSAGEADCPVFDGVFNYCQTYAGGSVNGAAVLSSGDADISFNWSGGMHHAKKAEASGFCYVNDIVLAILELLKAYQRVLYVDIDIHHGDGVEEAFYLTDRVMTVSFHKYGEFFPGTGAVDDIGYGKGKHYTVNVPLKEGMDDESYVQLYEPIMAKVMEMYQPHAIVMCCGADSLSGDRLGCFNLSMHGHSNCLEFLAKYNVPMLVLGGGGYTLRNVARCWCYETGRLMGLDLPDNLPETALSEYNYYLDTHRLRIAVSNMKNMNTREELEVIKTKVLENLTQLPPVPSVAMAYRPAPKRMADVPEADMDVRGGGAAFEDRRRVRPGDDSDDEGEPGTRQTNKAELSRKEDVRAGTPGTEGAGTTARASNGAGDAAPSNTNAANLRPASVVTSEALNGGRAGAAEGPGGPVPMDTSPSPPQAGARAEATPPHQASGAGARTDGGSSSGGLQGPGSARAAGAGEVAISSGGINVVGPSSGLLGQVKIDLSPGSGPPSMVGPTFNDPVATSGQQAASPGQQDEGKYPSCTRP